MGTAGAVSKSHAQNLLAKETTEARSSIFRASAPYFSVRRNEEEEEREDIGF